SAIPQWTSKGGGDGTRSEKPSDTTPGLIPPTTSMFGVHPTLKTDSGRLTTGDKAAIGLGVIVAVHIAILAAFAFVRYRTNNGSFFRRTVLRRELSRAKNFENSLY
ncbi:hypothetical protein EGW08_012420, partial [Elysia chlorotica]